ncbi:MAG: amidohydrolase family protein [Acidobacteria bacterium]|nr:amidohydrolase family protein [Acidobacteriota bacterium]
MTKQALALMAVVFFCATGGKTQNVNVAAILGYPQTIVYNGKIVTMDDSSFESKVGTIVQAMAIRDTKILATGSNAEIRALAGPQTKQIDLKGRTVLPSFILTHEHPMDWVFTEPRAFRHVMPNDDVIISRWLPNRPPKEQLALVEPLMRELVAKAKPGQWIRVIPNWGPDYEWAKEMGRIWDDSITKEYIDLLAPNNPVCVSDGFTAACQTNTRGIEEYRSVHPGFAPMYDVGRRGNFGEGQTKMSPEFIGRTERTGRIGRPISSDVILKGKLPLLADALKAELEVWGRYGITTFGSGPYTASNLRALHLLDEQGRMPARFAWAYDGPHHDLEELKVLSASLGTGTDYLWFDGVRGFGGGCFSVSARAEWEQIKTEYGGGGGEEGGVNSGRCSNAPGSPDYEKMVNIAQSGLRIAEMHSDGDKGIDYVMDAIEEGSKRAGMTLEEIRAKRHTFDHGAGAPRPQQIPRIKNLGMIVSEINTILWETHRGASVIARKYGIEYTNWVVPRKSLTDAGIMTTMEIDRPLPWKIFFFITKGMNRLNDRDKQVYGPGERTDRIIQLKALTRWGAYYLLREKTMGTLEPGKLADFIVLDRDFLTIPETEIPKIDVLLTVVGGKTVHLGADLAKEIGMTPVGLTTWTEPIPEGWEAKRDCPCN